MAERLEIAPGTFVFTTDQREVGTVATVEEDEIRVNLGDHRGWIPIPAELIDRVSSGRLLLTVDAAHLRRRFEESNPAIRDALGADEPRPAVTDHVPEEALQLLWDGLEERSWAGVHWLAHREESEHGSDRIDRAALHDIVKVARHLENSSEAFPSSFAVFKDLVNRHAETMAHETVDNA